MLRRAARRRGMRVPVAARASDDVAADLHERLRAFVARRISDPHAAADVAQEVLLRLHRSLGDIRVQDRLDAFAYRIARNAITDHYRTRAGARESLSTPDDLIARVEAEDGRDDYGAGDRGRQELARCLEPLVERLPEHYREALMLTDLGDLTQAEAAADAGISLPGMKSRVQRARAQLYELLTRCCHVTLDNTHNIAEVERTGPCACTPE
jgi:RNA polymerase sigma-70 factor (ECF subfamily)